MFFHSLFKRHYVALATAYQTDERGVSEMEQQPADVHSDLQTFIRLRKAELTPFNLQCIGIFFFGSFKQILAVIRNTYVYL